MNTNNEKYKDLSDAFDVTSEIVTSENVSKRNSKRLHQIIMVMLERTMNIQGEIYTLLLRKDKRQ